MLVRTACFWKTLVTGVTVTKRHLNESPLEELGLSVEIFRKLIVVEKHAVLEVKVNVNFYLQPILLL